VRARHGEQFIASIVTVWRLGLTASDTEAEAPRDSERRGRRLLLHNIAVGRISSSREDDRNQSCIERPAVEGGCGARPAVGATGERVV
jgi:hypothetical protein